MCPLLPVQEDLEGIFAKYDVDGSGALTLEEFSSLAMHVLFATAEEAGRVAVLRRAVAEGKALAAAKAEAEAAHAVEREAVLVNADEAVAQAALALEAAKAVRAVLK